jgi:hypothetical protein
MPRSVTMTPAFGQASLSPVRRRGATSTTAFRAALSAAFLVGGLAGFARLADRPARAQAPAPTPTSTGGPVTIKADRTTTIEAGPPLGAPIERAVKSDLYAQAVAADRDLRWSEAAALYQQAVTAWAWEHRQSPSPALERAIFKADRERQRSQLLAGMQAQRERLPPAPGNGGQALERARLYRTKLMVVRAYTGAVPDQLYARARRELEDALRLGDPARPAAGTEIRLLLCATRAAGGDRAAARLELAHVTSPARDDPATALPLAICRAALGELPAALAHLEAFVLRQPLEQRIDPFVLRDLYLANDWDRLRGDRRFENLFAPLRAY